MDTEELRKLLDEATPGPWRRSRSYRAIVSDFPSGYDDKDSVYAYGGHMVCESVLDHNRRLILAAPTLARRVIAAEKLVEALRLYSCENECDECADVDRDRVGCGWVARQALDAWEAAQ